jgi:putative MATE family efflux protein
MLKIETNFLDSPVGKTLFFKALPMFLGIFASIAYNLVDTFFVAKLGTDELAAMSFSFPVVMIILNIMMGISSGVSSLASRSIGAKQLGAATDAAKKGLQLTILFSLGVTIFGIFTFRPLFHFLGVDEGLMPHVQDYMLIWYGGVIFMNMAIMGSSIFRAKGNVFYPSMIMILGACLNAILDPILIFGWGPIPSYGVQGAAITTVIGNGLSVYLIFTKLHREEKIRLSALFKDFDFSLIKKILIIAIPTALANSLTPVSTAFTNRMLVSFGNSAVAANSIATRVETVPFVAVFALASVLSPFIGQNWGAKNHARVREGIKKSFLFTYLLGVFCATVLIFYRESISAMFDRSPEVVTMTSLYFSMIPFTYGILGTVFLTTNAMNAVGKPFLGNLLSSSRLLLIYLPLAYILNVSLGVKGIFMARFAANLIVGILATVLAYRVFFKKSVVEKSVNL